MASSYGPNFGFRRSDETVSVREGRLRLPAVTTNFYQGVPITANWATGELALAAANATLGPGLGGILVQEEEHINAETYKYYDNYDDTTGGRVVGTRLAIMWSGSGVKFWLKNTIGGVALFTETALAIGVKLGAAAGGGKWGRYSVGTTDVTQPFATITAYTGTPGAGDNYLEAVVL